MALAPVFLVGIGIESFDLSAPLSAAPLGMEKAPVQIRAMG